jgi:hypothetical protein
MVEPPREVVADVAAAVLHGVGNMLHSVNVSAPSVPTATLIAETFARSRLRNLTRIVALVHELALSHRSL